VSWVNDLDKWNELEARNELYWQNYHEEDRHMPKVTEMFGGAFLKADDLKGKRVTVTIEDCKQELLRGDHGEEEKWVLSFKGKEKRLVLNKTNANTIAALIGDDTDDWNGKEIKLYAALVDFQGRQVSAIRVWYDAPAEEAGEDEIPF
jgi:hypothetical protein